MINDIHPVIFMTLSQVNNVVNVKLIIITNYFSIFYCHLKYQIYFVYS